MSDEDRLPIGTRVEHAYASQFLGVVDGYERPGAGAHVLVRWDDDTRDWVHPDEIMPWISPVPRPGGALDWTEFRRLINIVRLSRAIRRSEQAGFERGMQDFLVVRAALADLVMTFHARPDILRLCGPHEHAQLKAACDALNAAPIRYAPAPPAAR